MSKPFIDSNIILYLLSGDAAKADRAQALLEAGAVISVQVLNEVTSVCLRKLKMPWEEIDALLLAVKAACEVLPLTLASHEKAVELARRFQLSFYDANIVACALQSGAPVLMSEDKFLGSEPKFTEPAARPKGAVLCTAVKLVSDPNNLRLVVRNPFKTDET